MKMQGGSLSSVKMVRPRLEMLTLPSGFFTSFDRLMSRLFLCLFMYLV